MDTKVRIHTNSLGSTFISIDDLISTLRTDIIGANKYDEPDVVKYLEKLIIRLENIE